MQSDGCIRILRSAAAEWTYLITIPTEVSHNCCLHPGTSLGPKPLISGTSDGHHCEGLNSTHDKLWTCWNFAFRVSAKGTSVMKGPNLNFRKTPSKDNGVKEVESLARPETPPPKFVEDSNLEFNVLASEKLPNYANLDLFHRAVFPCKIKQLLLTNI